MKRLSKITLMLIVSIGMLSFKSTTKEKIEFSYPKRENTTISFEGSDFEKFQSEWRGKDYYYMSMNKDSIICSVMYYKLNKDEQKLMVEPFGIIAAGIPFIFFSENSNLKKYEKNKSSWGETMDDFMFSQNDVLEFEGIKLNQKHMYAYAMVGKDIFLNIHLSKTNYNPQDSTMMRQILSSLQKKK